MTNCPEFDYLLVMPRLKVQNANAISSPLTHGFPAISAFIGLMWALNRKVQDAGLDLKLNAVGVVAHDYDEQISHEGYLETFRLTRNPVDKDGKTAAIVEEGRIHLEISLVFAVQGNEQLQDPTRAEQIALDVYGLLECMRVAGGTVIPSLNNTSRRKPFVVPLTGDQEGRDTLFHRCKMQLLPGFTLVERQDVLMQRHEQLLALDSDSTTLDAWLSLSRINWQWKPGKDKSGNDDSEKGEWQHDWKDLGWIVPMPLGFSALTDVQEAGSVTNSRDNSTPFRMVESVYGIGQWLSPHRLQAPQQMLWYADSQPEDGLYRCRNDYQPTLQPEFEFDFD